MLKGKTLLMESSNTSVIAVNSYTNPTRCQINELAVGNDLEEILDEFFSVEEVCTIRKINKSKFVLQTKGHHYVDCVSVRLKQKFYKTLTN